MTARRPRLGFLGLGWIGLDRLRALAGLQTADIVALADVCESGCQEALRIVPGAALHRDLDTLLELELDGIVIATPSALHAEQAAAALRRGRAVFCQKPLGRDRGEVAAVLAAAAEADRLLGVDLSYRHIGALGHIRSLAREGRLGKIFAAELTFHNAYGPDKPWFYDRRLSGGGCVIDLGIHLVDAALWILGSPITVVASRLYAAGRPWRPEEDKVETYAAAEMRTAGDTAIRLSCSWKLHAGRDAIIGIDLHGTEGGASFSNVDGSFYHFRAERFTGTKRELLDDRPEVWGGRALAAWVERLAHDPSHDPESAREHQAAAEILDVIYERSAPPFGGPA
jgi:predicted dehydrogenase